MLFIRKSIFWIFIATALGLAVWSYRELKHIKKPDTNPLIFFPEKCLAYFTTENFHELNRLLNSQSLIFKSWQSLEPVNTLSENLRWYDSLIYSFESIKNLCENNPVHFSIYKKEDSICWLIGIPLKELKQEKEFEAFFETRFKKLALGVYEIKKHHFLQLHSGIIFISNRADFIPSKSPNKTSLAYDESFLKGLSKCGKKSLLTFYVDKMDESTQKELFYFNTGVLFNHQKTWATITIGPKELTVTGINETEQIGSWSSDFTEWPYDKLPFATNFFQLIRLQDGKIKEGFFVNDSALYNENKEAWKKLDEKAMYPLHKQFLEAVELMGEFSWSTNNALIYLPKDTLIVRESLSHICDTDTLPQVSCIYKLKKGVNDKIAGNAVFRGRYMYALWYNQTLYFTQNPEVAKELLEILKQQSTLIKNSLFMEYASQNIHPSSHYAAYMIPALKKEAIEKHLYFRNSSVEKIAGDLTHASLTKEEKEDHEMFRIHLQYQFPGSEKMPDLLWQCKLEENLFSKPFPFTNHYTGETEIATQDNHLTLYLINATGNILWKKKLKEPILSDIYQVDIFKNGKKQLFFSTENYLHLIDRNGNYLNNYPLKLPSPASNQLSLIDYDNDGDTRVFIACANKKIYNYTLYGILAEGYKPYSTEDKVALPVKFIRVGESDYLITLDDAGGIHAFSRKGDARIGFKNKTIQNCADFALLGTRNVHSTYLYYIDEKSSLINKVSFADKKDVLPLNTETSNLKPKFANVNDDQIPDIIFSGESGTVIYDVNGNKLYENAQLKGNIYWFFDKFRGGAWLLAYNEKLQEIVIGQSWSSNTEKMTAGSPPSIIDLFGNGKKYLLYGLEGKLICRALK